MGVRIDGEHLSIELPGGTALFTSRRGGVSEGLYTSLNLGLLTDDDADHVRVNRRRVSALAGGRRLAQGRQVHGARVVVDAEEMQDADGQATTRDDVAAIVLVADCLPVALVAPGAVAMVHAGWRGLAAGALEAGVEAVGPGPVAAAIGPGIGPCCYEVGNDVRSVFGTSGRTLDLKAIARDRLRAAGVQEIHDCDLCTSCDPERFFSHRRDRGVTGRQAGVAWRS
ncbi:MAG: purine-nucleoside/S-methyl-5-thioadenosine phosphorylase / adenosine deaminase [Solirubrobacteraceae bacterium]|jgi:YfiH family protein|nr:purine-nucleoside/S-methyl-5-thioadenosine phosphorylase / adenosine deaminase [Solirubrobacteraceae bacterium]MEA2394021.1 purine-nucleoside/S-methyl-5-thioadenosine phosphorylase / adenosine deaminase [Solirubrobacteraceae bacterium]